MTDWKTTLYESYITTGQACTNDSDTPGMTLDDYPKFEQLIRNHLPAEKSVNILDLGCGHGALLSCLQNSGYTNSEGVDVSSEQVAHAHKLGIANVEQGDLMDYIQSVNKTYGVIFLMDVLEHFEKQQVLDLLAAARKSLSDSGLIIIHVPNAEGLFGMRVRYGDFTHELCFTPQSIKQVLTASGYRKISIHEDVPVVHGFKSMIRYTLWKILTLPARLLLLAETGTGGHILSQNMLIIAENHSHD